MKLIHVLKGLQQAEPLRMLNMHGLQSTEIGDQQRRELEADLGIPKTTVSEILMQDLGMKRVVVKFIPQRLHPEQKEHRAAVANDLIQTTTNEPHFLKKVTTGDEWWVCSCDPETKAQSSQWKPPGSPRLQRVQQSHSKFKIMLIVLFDWEGGVHHEYAPLARQLIRSTASMFFSS